MSKIQEQIFNAIDIITKQRISEIQFDKTIEVVVVDDSKAKAGEYKAQYQDLAITVYSNFNTIKYEVGDSVLVLVPQGDFSKKKTIVSSGGLEGEDYVDLEELPGTDIDKMGYNFVDEPDDFEVTMPTNMGAGEELTVTFNLKADDMVTYYPRKKVLIVGMVVYTDINIDDNGDYGIAIEATFIDKDGNKIPRILRTKLTDIVGNPFQSRGYKEMKVKLPEDERLSSVERGYAYAKDFSLGSEENIIKFSEINIQYGTSKDLENTSQYTGNILAPKGTIFKSGTLFPTEELELVMETKKQGAVIDNDEITYKWFEIDEEIVNSNQDGYHPDAGYGWRWLKEDIDGLTGCLTKKLLIAAKHIPNFSSFKCISNYKEFSINSNVVSITDNTDEMTTEVTSSNGYSFRNGIGTTTLKAEVRKNGEVQSNKDFLFKWIRISPQDGEQTTLLFSDKNSIPIDISTINGSSSFICEVYNKADEKLTISKGHTFLTVVYDAPQYGLSITGGFRAVLYDKNGEAPIFNPSQFNYTLFKNGEAVTDNLTQKWTIPDNRTSTMLTMEGSSDDDGDGYFSSNARSISLGIDKSFNEKKMENVLKLTVTHTENDIMETFTEHVVISITRVGESGATGPAGSTGVDGNTYVYEIQEGSRIFSYDQNGLSPTPRESTPFRFVFYKNGVDITRELESVRWTLPAGQSMFSFKGSETPDKIETKKEPHEVVLVPNDSWDDKKVNNVLKVELRYNSIPFREYVPITVNKSAKDGEPGPQGEGAYTVLLTNETHAFPAAKDGALLKSETTASIVAFKGSTPATFIIEQMPQSEFFNFSVKGNTITIVAKDGEIPGEDYGSFDFGISVDGKAFWKTMTWSLARRGETGEAAKYVILNGPQIISCAPGYSAPFQPAKVTLTSAAYGIDAAALKRTWFYKRSGEETWYEFRNETSDSIVIDPGTFEYWKTSPSLTIKCRVDKYEDQLTVVKVANGADGGSPYTISLESSAGLVFKQEELKGTIITATLKHGENPIPLTQNLRDLMFWEKIDKNGVLTSTENGTFKPTYVDGLKEKIKIEASEIVDKITINCGINQK